MVPVDLGLCLVACTIIYELHKKILKPENPRRCKNNGH